MKKLLVLIAAAFMCTGLFAQTVKGWSPYSDVDNGGSSTAKVTVNNGVTTVAGTVTTKYQYGYAGLTMNSDPEFISALKTAKGVNCLLYTSPSPRDS